MYVYTTPINLFYLLFHLPDRVITYFAKFDCKLHNPPPLALLFAGCVFL